MQGLDIKKQFGIFPMPVVVIGTKDGAKTNFMTAAWVVQVDYNPPMIGVVLSKNHLTVANIKKTGWFSINVPTVDQVVATDYVGIYSGSEKDKSEKFPVFYSKQKKVPMIEGCGISMECRLVETLEINTDPFFIGKIETLFGKEDVLLNDKPDFINMKPLLYSSSDGSYWSVGERLAKAWSIGEEKSKE
jgi:flavin reductase (DIM6/NTAB) family NADH-FMN oxidoreductase RutF